MSAIVRDVGPGSGPGVTAVEGSSVAFVVGGTVGSSIEWLDGAGVGSFAGTRAHTALFQLYELFDVNVARGTFDMSMCDREDSRRQNGRR